MRHRLLQRLRRRLPNHPVITKKSSCRAAGSPSFSRSVREGGVFDKVGNHGPCSADPDLRYQPQQDCSVNLPDDPLKPHFKRRDPSSFSTTPPCDIQPLLKIPKSVIMLIAAKPSHEPQSAGPVDRSRLRTRDSRLDEEPQPNRHSRLGAEIPHRPKGFTSQEFRRKSFV